jgi:hypothetical protein
MNKKRSYNVVNTSTYKIQKVSKHGDMLIVRKFNIGNYGILTVTHHTKKEMATMVENFDWNNCDYN